MAHVARPTTTFAEFQASRTDVANLSDETGNLDDDGKQFVEPGYRYAGDVWLVNCPDGSGYWTMIGGEDFSNRDRAHIEHLLYDYAISQGTIVPPATMQIYYISAEADPVRMSVEELIANFNQSGGWYRYSNAEDMRDALNGLGFYDNSHDNGPYVVINLAKVGLIPVEDFDADLYDAALAAKRGGK